MIESEFNDAAVRLALGRLEAALTDMTPVYQRLGEMLVQSTQDRMLRGEQPDGAPFAPRSQTTLERYQKTGQPHGPHPRSLTSRSLPHFLSRPSFAAFSDRSLTSDLSLCKRWEIAGDRLSSPNPGIPGPSATILFALHLSDTMPPSPKTLNGHREMRGRTGTRTGWISVPFRERL